MGEVDRFAEYQIFVEDTARFTDRRKTDSNTYVGINSILLTGIGVLIAQGGIEGSWMLILPLPLVAAGIAVSLWWRQFLIKNKALVRLRMQVLREMEDSLAGSVKMYHREDALYPVDEQGRPIEGQGLNLVDLEMRLPWLFLALYSIFGVGLAAAFLAEIVGIR
jgi:hypothetical protein